jgi:flagellar protein FliS
MQPSARDSYLETQVMTASPQKLRLMLIEGAIRFANQTQHLWEQQRDEEALESSIRAREIVSELMTSLSGNAEPLAKQILPLYVFIFRTITEAQLERSAAKLADALRVLGEERETWRQVCEKFVDIDEAPPVPVEITASQTLADAPVTSAAPLSFDSSRFDSSATPATPTTARPAVPGRLPPLSMPAAAPRGVSFEA